MDSWRDAGVWLGGWIRGNILPSKWMNVAKCHEQLQKQPFLWHDLRWVVDWNNSRYGLVVFPCQQNNKHAGSVKDEGISRSAQWFTASQIWLLSTYSDSYTIARISIDKQVTSFIRLPIVTVLEIAGLHPSLS